MINLLRSPTYGDGVSAIPSRHTEDHVSSSSTKGLEDTTNDSRHHTITNDNKGGGTTPRLGDFGSLWDILGQGTTTKTAETEHRQDADATSNLRSHQSLPPIRILKRPSSDPADPVTRDPPRTPPKSIPGSTTKSRNVKVEVDVESGFAKNGNNEQPQVSHETTSSDSAAEAESDGVFDPPLSKKGGSPSKPSKVETPSARIELYDSPPSSFDELDGSLTAETIKKSPNGVIRVQSNAYKSAKERKAGLLAKLLNKFPECAEPLSQVGQSANTNSGNPSSRPIHVFVDISNVSPCPCHLLIPLFTRALDHGWIS